MPLSIKYLCIIFCIDGWIFRCIKDYDRSKYLTVVISNKKEKDVE